VAKAGPLRWHDAAAGWVAAAPLAAGDVVLSRKDAPGSYHLCVTVDDGGQGVTDVVRGMDLFDATHVHCLLQALLGLGQPRYHHHALLTDRDGKRLAKRDGAPTLARLREGGADPVALVSALRTGAGDDWHLAIDPDRG
jgi:glutamyl-Q tRNA(Asp) synthetase